MRVYDGFVVLFGVLAGAGCLAGAEPGSEPADLVGDPSADPVADPAAGADGAPDRLGAIAQAVTLDERIAACAADPRVAIAELSVDSCVGGDLFLRETFGGNGRSCATCHPVAHNFTIDPGFIASLPASDPLFIAEQQNALARLEVPAQMRQFGLILENVDGFTPDPTTRFVLRSVPHTFSMSTSIARTATDPPIPVHRTGWSGDGAPGNGALRDFQTGAIRQHYTRSLARVEGRDFRLATAGELDRIDRFMRQLGRLNELDITTAVLEDPGAEIGRQRFIAVGCHACHGNAGANASFAPGNFNFNTGVESARHPALAGFPRDGGFGATPLNNDGSFGDGTFNTPPLIEAADTGPFFHTATRVAGASAHNAAVANTIEQAVAFYDTPAFNNSPAGQVAPIDLSASDITNIGRFLRVLNAQFNIAVAARRLATATALLIRFGNGNVALQRSLLRLAQEEAEDGLRMLTEVPGFGSPSVSTLNAFIVLMPALLESTSVQDRLTRSENMRLLLDTAARRLGTGLTIEIGDGVVVF